MENNIQMIEGFVYEFKGKIIGVITESEEDILAFHFKPNSKAYSNLLHLTE